MADPSLELQRALRAQLLASPAVTALVGQRIYDQPPISPQFPYITLGETDVLVQRAAFYDGSDVSMSVHAWSRANGYPESKRIASAIRASLHEAPITLAGLERLVDIEVQSNRTLRDPDGLTSHAVITLRALTEPVNEEGDLRLVGAAGFQAQGASTRSGALVLAGSAALQATAPTVSSTASAFAGSSSFVAATGGFYPFTFALTGGTAFQPQATAIRSTVLALSGSTALQARVGGISPAALAVSGSTTLQARAPAALPPTITSSTTQTVAENSPFSLNLTASEAGTWAITGGADAAMFEIAGSSASAEALDFELPEDADHNNVYDVQITFTATATGLTDTKMFHLTVTDVAEALTLAPLTLSANTIAENSVVGTPVGAIVGQTAGSTLTLIADAGGRFAFQGALPAGADALWYADQANTTAVRQYVPNEITKATVAVPTWVNRRPKVATDLALTSVTQTTGVADSFGGHDALRLVGTGSSWAARDDFFLNFKAMQYTLVLIGKTNAGSPQTAKLNFGFAAGTGTTVTFNTTLTRVSHTVTKSAGLDNPLLLSSSGAGADITIDRWFVYEGADPFPGNPTGDLFGGHILFGGDSAYAKLPTVAANEVDISVADKFGQLLFDSYRSLASFTAFACVRKVGATPASLNTIYSGWPFGIGDIGLSLDYYGKGPGFTFQGFEALGYRQPFIPGVSTMGDLLNTGYNVLVWKYDAATSTASFWINDVLFAGQIVTKTALSDFHGLLFNDVFERSSVKWNSGAFYPAALSRANIESVVTLLKAKAAANGLTLDTMGRFFCFEGDSNTDGAAGTAPGGTSWPYLFAPNAAFPFYGMPFAQNGGTLATMVARAPILNAAVPTNKAGRKFILAGMIGTNDASTNYTSDSATYSANLLAYWAAAKAAGWITIGIPILPRTDVNVPLTPVSMDTWRGAINSNLMAAVGNQLDACVNPASFPLIFANGASDNTTYFKTDKVHLTTGAGTTGQAVLEAAIRPIINSFL